MIRKKRLLALVIGACIFSTAFSGETFARTSKKETRQPIETMGINVVSQVQEGDDWGYIVAAESTGMCTVGNYEWSGMSTGGWAIGDKPKVKIYFHAKGGNYFNKINGKGKITVTGADYSTARITDNKETLIVTVELKPVAGKHDSPDDAEWVGFPYGLGEWTPVKGIDAYALMLYRDGQRIWESERVTGTQFDFFPYMDRPGTYEFRVRGVAKDSAQEAYIVPTDWMISDEQNIDWDETPAGWYGWNQSTLGQSAPEFGWQKDSEGWWYKNPDGSYPRDTWAALDGKWYLFDYRGYMLKGWQMKDQHWYYLSDNGDMQTGWFQDGRQWYYLGDSGAAAIGWNTIDGSTYYMNDQCAIVYAWWLIDGKWYYFDTNSGKLARNTWIGGRYVNQDGVWIG